MDFKTILVLFALCAIGNGIPLENPSTDMSKFFSQRIVGGVEAPDGYAPHMASLVIGGPFTSLVCGASIVAPNIFLTAAHCIDMFVVWGELLESFHGIVGTNRWNKGTHVYFKTFHIHPQWSWATIKNDIGFLILDKPLTLDRNIRVMPLNLNRIEREEASYVTGWGALGVWGQVPDILQLLYVTTMLDKDCIKGVEQSAAEFGQTAPPVDPKIEICTFHSFGHGVCNGDSGSALVSLQTKSQIGLVSWGFPCAVGAPDIFVRVSGFRSYILDVMGQHK